jgi:hypothetical protein
MLLQTNTRRRAGTVKNLEEMTIGTPNTHYLLPPKNTPLWFGKRKFPSIPSTFSGGNRSKSPSNGTKT